MVIYPAKDDMMRVATRAAQFRSLHTVKITGECDTVKFSSVYRALTAFPALKNLILEKTDIERFPTSPALNASIEKIELYENEQLDYADVVDKAKATAVKTLLLDVYEFSEIPSNLSVLPNLSELKVYDKNSVVFDPHKKYEGDDADVKENKYMLTGPGKSIAFSFASAEYAPARNDIEQLRKSTGAENAVKDIPAVYEAKYEHILPPVSGLNAPKEMFSLPVQQKQTIVSAGGTVLEIPANAFVDKNGNRVTGKVDIGYREFRNQLDILVSGIPMVFDSAGTKKQFESAGMFEITASVNGEEVFLAKDKRIDVEFTLSDSTGGYNLYYYNDKKGNWENEQEVKPASRTAKSAHKKVRLSHAAQRFVELTNKPKGLRYDTTRFENRFERMDYTYIFKKGCLTKTMAVENGKTCDIRKVIRIVSSGKGKGGEQYFRILNHFSTNPELSFFKNVTLVLDGNEKEFRETAAGKYFNDARVEGNGESFELVLKGKNGFTRVPFHMVVLDHRGEAIEKNLQPKIAWARYTKKIKARAKIWNRRIMRHTNTADAYEVSTKEEIVAGAFEIVKPFMNLKERQMSMQRFKAYADSLYALNMLASVSGKTAGAMSRTRNVSLGVVGNHNFDRERRIATRVDVFVKLNNVEKKGIRLKTVSAIEKLNNTVYSYPAGEKVTLDKEQDYVIVGFTEEGKMVWSENGMIKGSGLGKNDHINIEADVLEKNPESMEDMKKLLGLQ